MLVDFNTGKTQVVSFDQFNNNGSIDVKMVRSILEEKSSFKTMGLLCISINLTYAHVCNTVVTCP